MPRLDNLRAVYDFSAAGLAAGRVPSELEYELIKDHGVHRQLVDQVMPLIRVLYDAEQHRRMTYSTWLTRALSPSRAPLAEVAVVVLTMPLCFWFAYQIGILAYQKMPIEPPFLFVIVLVALLLIPIQAVVGFPLFFFTRWFWNRRADWVRSVRAPRLSTQPMPVL